MNSDYIIDDILQNSAKGKKVNSKDKGQRGERDLCAVLCARFPNHDAFVRVVGSGNRWAQAALSKQAKEVLTSDINGPTNFKFSIECKYGYANIDLGNSLDNGIKELDGFLEQVDGDSEGIKKLPMLCWRKPRYSWIVFIKAKDAPPVDFTYKLHYREWIGVSLTELLNQKDNYFFND